MTVVAFPSGPFSTNAYLVICPATKHAAIVDPAPGCSKKIISYVKDNLLIIDKILLTHSHWDHIADAAFLAENYQVTVYVHPEDAENVHVPGSDLLPCWMDIPPVTITVPFKEKDQITIGQLVLEVIETPGHTPGGVCFYCPAHHLILTGDTLFQGTIGNLSFPTARPESMWGSLDKLAKLPAKTVVYPGHGPRTTIAAESWLPNARKLFS
jgi:hydroxyacylglutathione hydrolase